MQSYSPADKTPQKQASQMSCTERESAPGLSLGSYLAVLKEKKENLLKCPSRNFRVIVCEGERTSARQSDVWVCVHKQLHVKHISHFLRVEDQDPLKENDICWINRDPFFQPGEKKLKFQMQLRTWWFNPLLKTLLWHPLTWNGWQNHRLELQPPDPPRCPSGFCTLTRCRTPL